ncbi:ion transporter [Paracrocinitomix mangrovi]|uniref:ion transporter n=1 Tax=Paracrocinitomix mangrovi TaxID=2862509 RepID=UPI001C8ECCAD|nr:ion transporter [Paracrocinitomix mangrovi]UKN01911.1 ion transporter [Paracrocinitomix mangrovi]
MSGVRDTEELRPWQKKMNEVIFGSETPAGKWFDIVLLILITLSVIAIMLESVPNYREKYGVELHMLEWVFTGIFTAEYVARLICVKKPIKYMLSFYGIIDLLSVIPTYIGIFYSGTSALRVLRCIRLIRVFRILKLSQFVDDANYLITALKSSKNKIIVFLFTVTLLVIILGTIMYLVEGAEGGFDSIPRSVYWAIVTLTTVGYGDISPTTPAGQFVASFIMILGYAIIAVPTGIVTNEFIRKGKAEISNRACPNCSKDGHDADADYCNHCGSKL